MGKEWHFGGRSPSRRARDATADHHRRHRPSLSGCMSTLFGFFDFHSSHFKAHFVFNKHHYSSSNFDLSHPPPLPKASFHHGAEAPRNSLELDEASIYCLRNKEENLQFQMGLQIKTRNGSTKTRSKASEQQLPNIDHIALESPSANTTPNLLARFMGLDILPQTSSRRQQKPGACNYHVSGTRSLPKSPRVSSTRLSDVDRHHRRFSLQINVDKENIRIHEEVKREEENVGRKVALIDITNNCRGKLKLSEPDLDFSQSKVENSSKRFKKMVVDESKSKPRNQEVIIPKRQKPKSILMARSKPRDQKEKPREEEEEAFRCPTSNNLFNNLNRPSIFLVKKNASPPAAKIPHEQPCSYPKAKQKLSAGDGGERDVVVGSTDVTAGRAAEFKYIERSIPTSHSISMNSSPSIPQDPSIFHHLETTAAAVAATEEFPRANCEVLEDVDVFIDKDLEKWKKFAFWRVAEIEGVVKLVEFHILDSLLREIVAAIYTNGDVL